MLLEKSIVPLNYSDEVIVNMGELLDFIMQLSIFLRAHQLETHGSDERELAE